MDASADGSVIAPQEVGAHIVVDQFGYRVSAEKIAVIRNPKTGFDSDASYASLGGKYALVDSASGQTVVEGAATFWGGDAGVVDPSSGDQTGWFDFSTFTTPGSYYVLEETSSVRSSVFKIADSVYQDALVQAARVFYYQRDAAKPAAYAGTGWADTAEHPQNAQCKLYTAVDAGAPTRDLHGGWFDAGDQSKYTIFTANNAIELLRAYSETPSSFTDSTNVPESGNGVPDVLDEVKWGLDWLSLMQNPDGSVLSIVNNAGASPPSADNAPCTYGPASTSATMAASAAFAYASRVLGSGAAASAYPGYAAGLATRATNSWSWASANPAVAFDNTAAGLGGREEEVNDNGRLYQALQAAVFLFEMNGGAAYQAFFDANYAQLPTTLDPFAMGPLDTALEYTRSAGATPAVASAIISSFQARLAAFPNFAAQQANGDPYLAPLQTYPWGSNGAKAGQGNMFFDLDEYAASDAGAPSVGSRYAERYIHYLHGVNPLGLVYLSNMGAHGATNSVSRIFSLWFTPSSQWAAAGASAYGPPPGFLPAGPNPTYSWDVCCPTGCGSPENDALCGAAPLAPPAGQPIQKSYRDFNSSWPLDSWLVSEPNDRYEVEYIRLLSKFVH